MSTGTKRTTDKTTFDGGFNQGKRVAASYLTDEDFSGYYALIHGMQNMIANDMPRRYYLGYIDGAREAMRAYKQTEVQAST